MSRVLPITTALALVIAVGLVHGQWTRRWSPSHAVEAASARLARVPMILGDWQGRPLEMNREEVAMAEIVGFVSRRYEDRRRKAAVTILLVCGRPGPISVHTPDICYAGAGYEQAGPPTRRTLPVGPAGQSAGFRHAVFSKANSPVPTYLRILWSWSADGAWDAPENPRLAFAPRNFLYKLYVIHELTTAEERLESDPSLAFLGILLPAMERALFAHE